MVPPVPSYTPKSSALRALQDRGFLETTTDLEAIDNALGAGVISFYVGYDPTASSLHAGSLVCIMAMRLLQRHGHQPIVLLGGGTARVGDPTGRNETRKMLDEATLDFNVASITKQFDRFLSFDASTPNPAVVVDNADWLCGLRYLEFLRTVGSQFTVNRMIAAKTYRDRLDNEQPLSFLEFNYQLLQAYDFLHLQRTYGCTMQLGGSDQWGNVVAGIELIRRIGNASQGPAHGITWPLLTTADGRKMGKTARGAVWLDPEQCSPFDYYQYWISCDDRDVRGHLLRFTDLELEEIDSLCSVEGAALREVKARLAKEATRLAHGDDAADRAASAAAQAFGGGGDWSAVPAAHLEQHEIKLIDLVVDDRIKAFGSKRQARQRIESGAVKIDGEPIKDPAFTLLSTAFADSTFRLQVGKKCRYRVLLGSSTDG